MGEQARGGLPEEEQLELKADEWESCGPRLWAKDLQKWEWQQCVGCYLLSPQCDVPEGLLVNSSKTLGEENHNYFLC